MARGIKWRLQFKSLQNIGCLVNIYEENYTSSADTTKTGANVPFTCETGVRPLMGAAVPFEYEEEDSDDLLELIRYRTGYIRVIEVTYDELADLIPTTLTDHYVEAYYGSELVFTGFMQMQTFQQPWVAVPRELEFPIVSPLGLLDSFDFPLPGNEGIHATTTGKLLKLVADILDAGYTHVAYPVDTNASGDVALYPWKEAISAGVAVALNTQFKRYNTEADLYKPNNIGTFLHGICATMGWWLHEWPGRLFFSSPTCTSCGLLPLSSVEAGTDTGWTRVAGNAGIGNYFMNADDDASITTIAPLKSLKLSANGEKNAIHALPTEYGYANSVGYGYFYHSNKWGVAGQLIVPAGIVATDYYNDNLQWVDGTIMKSHTSPFFALVLYGCEDYNTLTVSPSVFWLAWTSNTLTSTNKLLFAYKINGLADVGKFILKCTIEVGSDLKDMSATGWGYDIIFQVVIYDTITKKYLDMSTSNWSSSIVYNAVRIDQSTGKILPNISTRQYPDNDGYIFDLPYGLKDLSVQVYVNSSSGIDPDWLIKFVDFSIKRLSEWTRNELDWQEQFDDEALTLKGSDKGIDDGSLTLEVNNFYPNSNYFANIGSMPTMESKYAHVFTPTSILKQRMMRKNASGWTFAWYAGQYGYWRSENPVNPWYWHILAHSFNLRDDEVGLTLITPNVSYVYTQAYQVAALLDNVRNTFPATVAEHASVQWSVVAEDGYAVDYVKVMMGGVDITSTAWSSSTSKITITDVTGDIEITASAVAVTYTVSNDLTNVSNSNSATTATGGSQYLATLTAAAHSTMDSVTVEMGGVDITSRVYNSSTGVINIPVVTGNIEITASAVASEVMLTQTLTHVTSSVQDGYVPIGSSLTVTYSEDSGYHIDSSQTKVYMGGVDVTSSVIGQSSTGIVMYISNVTGPVVVTVVAEAVPVVPYDAVVEYLETDGTAYIDTGINTTNTTQFDMKMWLPNEPTNSSIFPFGGRKTTPGNTMEWLRSKDAGRWQWRCPNNTYIVFGTSAVNGEYLINNMSNANVVEFSIEGGTLKSITATASTFNTGRNFFLFTVNNNGSPRASQSGIRFYWAKIYSGGTLVRDYIAVRKNGIGYLYDKVSGTLYGNAAASGAFSYGNDVNT